MAEHEREADYLILFTAGQYAVFDDRGGTVAPVSTVEVSGADDQAAYRTLLEALRSLWQRLGAQVAKKVLVVRGDRQPVIEQLLGKQKPADEVHQRLRDEAWQLLSEFKRYWLVYQSPEDTRSILGS